MLGLKSSLLRLREAIRRESQGLKGFGNQTKLLCFLHLFGDGLTRRRDQGHESAWIPAQLVDDVLPLFLPRVRSLGGWAK